MIYDKIAPEMHSMKVMQELSPEAQLRIKNQRLDQDERSSGSSSKRKKTKPIPEDMWNLVDVD